MTTWFTSDTHFGHRRIIELCNRPFASVEEMDAEIVRRWNEVVSSNDTVYVLGDVALGKLDESLGNIKALNGTKHLVAGNHDRCWSGFSTRYNSKDRPWEIERYFEAGFATITEEAHVTVSGQTFLLSHFPYTETGDAVFDKYAHYRPNYRGMPLLHGHIHEKRRLAVEPWQLNVGVDVNEFTPVSEYEVIRMLLSESENADPR